MATTNDFPYGTRSRVPRLSLMLLFIVAANIFDTIATLALVSHGDLEWNPIMRFMIAVGPRLFSVCKIVTTTTFAIFLALIAHRPDRRVRPLWRLLAWIGLCAICIVFAALTVLHVYLLHHAHISPS